MNTCTGAATTTEKPATVETITHDQGGLHLVGVNLGQMLEEFIKNNLPMDDDFRPRPGINVALQKLQRVSKC